MPLFFGVYYVEMQVTINLYNCLSDDILKTNFLIMFGKNFSSILKEL
jgi:hypothetical protein